METKNESAVPKIKDMYGVFITTRLAESKAFYEKWFGFKSVFDSNWFLVLLTPGEDPKTLAFLHEDWPEKPAPPRYAAYNKSGSYLTIEFDDVTALYQRLKAGGMTFEYDLKDEPWGQRRFCIIDPGGVFLDIVETTTPQAGYWDKYMNK